MGKIIAPISERKVAALSKTKKRRYIAVGGVPGLYLAVGEETGRSWIWKYRFGGRRRELGLGSLIDVTLEQARDAARAQRKVIQQGLDPVEAKRAQIDKQRAEQAKRTTFRECLNGYIDAHASSWKNAKHRDQWGSVFENHAKVILDLDVRLIDTPLILKILEPIWSKKTETADRLRGRIDNVLAWAIARGYRQGENPARWRGLLDQLLPPPSKVAKKRHFPALPFSDTGAFMQELREQEGIAARTLEFTILTAARSGEARGARWEEIDFDSKVWKVPGNRMKAGREHVVPLSDAALAVIQEMQKNVINGFIFPSLRDDKPLSDMSLTAVLRRMKHTEITVHGFRSTFRDWAAEISHYPHEVCEMALAHVISNKAEAAYRRGNLLAKRRAMMQDWAKWCAKPHTKAAVVPMRKSASA